MKTKKLILAKLDVKPEALGDFLEFAPTLINGSRNEAGNISYVLYRDSEEPARFIFVQEWKDQAAIDFHFAQPYFVKFGEIVRTALVSEADIKVYDVPAG